MCMLHSICSTRKKNPFQLYPNCQYWRIEGEEWKESIESLKGKQAHEHGAQCTHKRAHDVTKKERFAIDVNCELNLLSSGMSTKKNMSIKIFHAFSTSAITNLHLMGECWRPVNRRWADNAIRETSSSSSTLHHGTGAVKQFRRLTKRDNFPSMLLKCEATQVPTELSPGHR